jgi:hypothetical protein
MPTTRPFAYNTGSLLSGTTQVGNLAIGTTRTDYGTTGGIIWWNGPDEDLGYIIAQPVSGNTQPTPVSGVTASIGFFRSTILNDASFIEISNRITNQGFTGATQASSWLTTNGYWNSYITYTAGLFKRTYAGYFADNVSFFATATPGTYGSNPATSVQTTVITEPGTDDGSNFSVQWLGYFKPTTTETYTFYTASDDASYLWIGTNALSGFTTTNATVNNGGAHAVVEISGTAVLTAGTYYPIRMQFGEAGGGDAFTFSYSTPTITKTTNVTGLVFYNTTTNGF